MNEPNGECARGINARLFVPPVINYDGLITAARSAFQTTASALVKRTPGRAFSSPAVCPVGLRRRGWRLASLPSRSPPGDVFPGTAFLFGLRGEPAELARPPESGGCVTERGHGVSLDTLNPVKPGSLPKLKHGLKLKHLFGALLRKIIWLIQ